MKTGIPAEKLAPKWIGENYASVMRHYELAEGAHHGVKGCEFCTHITKHIDRHGVDAPSTTTSKLMP